MSMADVYASGRLWGFAFSAGKAFAVPEAAPAPQGDWTWAHFALSDQRSRVHIERFAPIAEAARATLLGAHSRVQAHADGDWTYGVLPDFEHELDGRADTVGRLFFAFDEHRLITARRHALHGVDGLRRRLERGEIELAHPCDAITALVTSFVVAVGERLVELSARIDHAEDVVLSERGAVSALRLGPLRRELSGHHREFAALKSSFHRLGLRRHGDEAGPLVERLPALLPKIEDFDRDIADMQDRARLMHEEIEARLAAAANRSLRLLTVLSTLLLPPTVVVGAFGMNVQGVPFATHPYGFWLASGLCVGVVALSLWGLWLARALR